MPTIKTHYQDSALSLTSLDLLQKARRGAAAHVERAAGDLAQLGRVTTHCAGSSSGKCTVSAAATVCTNGALPSHAHVTS